MSNLSMLLYGIKKWFAKELITEEILNRNSILYVVGSGYSNILKIDNTRITTINRNNFTFIAVDIRMLISLIFFAVSFDNFML